MQAVIAAFADAALHAKNIGIDFVEIHGGHGYLIDQLFGNAPTVEELNIVVKL
ncbi:MULTISPECIES: hypothetical protein [unclassified Mucilaginibacter]|uniref:oxidoreductase n=1 Tax=unclassified Mucilaginibacter TaxID=2617802 RepID=UPI00339349DD